MEPGGGLQWQCYRVGDWWSGGTGTADGGVDSKWVGGFINLTIFSFLFLFWKNTLNK